jgi:hypothetical protein
MLIHLKKYRLILIFTLLCALMITPVRAQDETEQALIQLVAESEEFADWLAQYEGWQGHAYPPEDGTVWYVEFYTAEEDDWLGYANIDANTGEIQDSLVPSPLPPDEFAAGQERVNKLVLNDPEVIAWLVDPILWYPYVDFNRYERIWEMHFYRGKEAVMVKVYLDEFNFSIQEIVDENVLTEEEALQNARDEAINLAYGAEGLDTALEGFDNWRTYVENQGGPRWSVTFAADERELFYALVDVAADKVIEASAGG